MGTKNEPGKFDCYAKADPDEPMFTLLGRDADAAFIVRVWIHVKKYLGDASPEKLAEAEQCAKQLEDYYFKGQKMTVRNQIVTATDCPGLKTPGRT